MFRDVSHTFRDFHTGHFACFAHVSHMFRDFHTGHFAHFAHASRHFAHISQASHQPSHIFHHRSAPGRYTRTQRMPRTYFGKASNLVLAEADLEHGGLELLKVPDTQCVHWVHAEDGA